MKRVIYLLIAFVMVVSISPVYQTNAAAADQVTLMKVKLKNYLGNQTSIDLKSNGEYQLDNGTTFIESSDDIQVKVESGELVVYKGLSKIGSYDTFTISPKESESLLYINNRSYHGSFQFVVDSGKYVRPINSLYIEDYLRGVVPYEMPASWPIEALKAQTVAARNYALSNQGRIIDDTISYQVYGGAEGHINSDKAISETNGLVLKYNNSLVYAFFSSSNGGMTEINSNVWASSEKLPYFSIQEDTYDPKTVWSIKIDKQQIDLSDKDLANPEDWWTSVTEKDQTIVPEIKKWLKNNGYPNKEIKITKIPVLSLGEKTSGGRVTKGSIQINFYVKDIVNAQGKLIPQTLRFTNVAASKVRAIVGLNMIKSYLVDESSSTSNTINLKGRGYGHGVGLSQYGAKKRAEAGQTYEDILKFYYPGATLVKEYSEGIAEMAEENMVDQNNTSVPPTSTVSLSNVSAKANYSNETAKIAYHVSENANVTVTVKNSKGAVVAMPVKQRNVNKGSRAVSWNFGKSSDGTYKVTIAATGSNQQTKTTTKTLTIKRTKATVTAKSLNIRAKKSTTSKIVGKLKKNQTIIILAKENSWYKIKTGSKTGYMATKYAKIK